MKQSQQNQNAKFNAVKCETQYLFDNGFYIFGRSHWCRHQKDSEKDADAIGIQKVQRKHRIKKQCSFGKYLQTNQFQRDHGSGRYWPPPLSERSSAFDDDDDGHWIATTWWERSQYNLLLEIGCNWCFCYRSAVKFLFFVLFFCSKTVVIFPSSSEEAPSESSSNLTPTNFPPQQQDVVWLSVCLLLTRCPCKAPPCVDVQNIMMIIWLRILCAILAVQLSSTATPLKRIPSSNGSVTPKIRSRAIDTEIG